MSHNISVKEWAIKNRTKLLYIGYFGIMLSFFMAINVILGDDMTFKNILKDNNYDIIGISINRYFTHESRFLVIGLAYLNLLMPFILWKISNALVYTLIAYFISKLILKKEDMFIGSIIVISLIFLFDLQIFQTAGWITTFSVYTYTLLGTLLSLYILKKIANNEKVRKIEYIIYGIITIYAANLEQNLIIIIAFYFFFSVWMIIKKNINIYPIIMTVLVFLEFIFIITCPGNKQRIIEETRIFFPDYANYHFPQKVDLGLFSVSKSIIEPFFIATLLLLIIAMFLAIQNKKFKGILKYVLGIIPTFLYLSLYFVYKRSNGNIVIGSKSELFIDIFTVLLFLSIALIVFLKVENKMKRNIICLTLMLGFVSKFIMGFSASVWASRDRTGYLLFISIIVSIVMIIDELKLLNEENVSKILISSAVVLGSYGFVNSLITSFIMPSLV